MSAMASDFLMIMKKCKTTAATIGIVLFLCSRFINADPAQQLIDLLAPLNTLNGEFQQTLTDANGEVLQESNGVFSLKRPGFFRWQTVEPFPQLLVSNQQTIWLYDEDLEQVIVRPYTESINQTPALLLSGDPNKLSSYYRVQSENINEQEITFTLVSNSEALPTDPTTQPFTQIVLSFNNRQLSAMQLTDTLGQVSSFYFTDLIVNPVLASDIFSFTPPPGVDVIVDD